MGRILTTDWRAVTILGIESAEEYEVSEAGVVRISLSSKQRALRRGRVMPTHPDTRGYPMVNLYVSQRVRATRVHRIVADAFLGPLPRGLTVNHKDGDKTRQ